MLGDVVKACGVVANPRTRDDGPDGRDHEQDDRGYLDSSEPKFGLAEHLHAQHVEGKHHAEGDER